MDEVDGMEEMDRLRAVVPTSTVLKPPVSAEDLKAHTEYGPQGAEEFVALIRALRRQSRP